eukprot:11881794-Karenia_brevis.AAC.1
MARQLHSLHKQGATAPHMASTLGTEDEKTLQEAAGEGSDNNNDTYKDTTSSNHIVSSIDNN